jgi:hypothetical protein
VDTPVYFRNSERATYRDCRLHWHWKYDLRLTSPNVKGALSFGRVAHKALELYYPPGRKRGPHPAESFEMLMESEQRLTSQWDDEGNRHDPTELGIAMMNSYVDEYGNDDHIEIIAPEMPLSVDVFDKQGRYLCTWVGKSDACYRDLSKATKKRDCLGLLEHKTAKVIEQNLRINSGYGDQALGYWWAGSIVLRDRGIIKDGQSIDHVLVNWLRKALPDTRPVNFEGHRLNKPTKDALLAFCISQEIAVPKKATGPVLIGLINSLGFDAEQLGEPSKNQGSDLLQRVALDFGDGSLEMINWRIRAEAWEREQVRAGKLPIYKNPTKDCGWKCEFVEACELHEMGGDWESVLQLEFVEWDPYEDHEEDK